MRLRTSNHCRSLYSVTSVPNRISRPALGLSSPSAIFSNTVLPLPAAPSTISVSPAPSSNEMCFSTVVSPMRRLISSKASCAATRSGIVPHSETKIRPMKNVSTTIHTLATTIACVVARPTPCVPPSVRMP